MSRRVVRMLLVPVILIATLGFCNILQPAKVVNVIDGDTIDVQIDQATFRVRLIGVDCPEITNGKNEYMGLEAANYVAGLVMSKTVYLEKDVSETDQFGRLLRYVWLVDSTDEIPKMLNALLVQEGLAKAAKYPPDVRYADTFELLQGQAMAANKGIWKSQATQTSIQVLSYTASVKRGGTASIKIKGIPGVKYSCTVRYKSGYSSAAGLGVKTADKDGIVSWSWQVGSRTTPGNWPIIITNLSNGLDTVTVYFQVY